MTYQLARIVQRTKTTRRKSITLKPIETTQTLERELAAIYVRMLRAWAEQARDRILPAYQVSLEARTARMPDGLTRDDAKQIESGVEVAEGFIDRLILMLTPELRNWVIRVERWHRTKFVTVTKTATGIDLTTLIGPEGAQETMAAVLARNVSLVRDVSDEARKRIAESVWRGFTSRTPRVDVAKEINEAVQLGRERSLRIASDQTVKMAAALDEERQREAGITEFLWRHSGKVHFRPEHKARDGQVFSWGDNNLGGDLPGIAPFCGCKAQAYLNLENL